MTLFKKFTNDFFVNDNAPLKVLYFHKCKFFFVCLQLNMTEPEKEMFNIPVVRYCTSDHAKYFTLALYGVKGTLLTFGLFLAWETRNICISQLNDSKYTVPNPIHR